MPNLAKPRKSKWRPSGIVNAPTKPSNRFGEALDTKRQQRLYAAANKLLAKAGAFAPKEEHDENIPVDANAIGSHGHLRPTWQGRV